MKIYTSLKPLLIIGGVFIFGLIIKLKDLNNFWGKDNIFSCFDCFWYARLSKELKEGIYISIDYLRNVPDFVVNLSPPPLISIIPYWLSKLTTIEIKTFFVLIPPIFSLLFIIPLYFWIKKFAPVHIFLGGAILGIFNLIYFNRTTLGRFDTDSLILFFIFSMLIFITKAVYEKEKSYFWIVISAIIFNIFMWWYYKPIFSLFFSISLFLGLIYAKENWKNIFFKIFLFILLTSPLYLIESLIKYSISYIKSYILKETSQIVPFSIAANILELRPVDFNHLVLYTTDNLFTAILAFIGLIFLFYKQFKYMLIALPIIILGLTTFFAGNRFIMYLAPFLGMGLGYIFYYLTNLLQNKSELFRKKIIYILSILLVIFFSFPAQRLYSEAGPIIKQELWENLKKANHLLEKNSYIWTWWDYGYLLQYLLNKGTYVDNGNQNTLKLYLFAHSMMLYDEDKSRNIIAFTTNNLYKDYGLRVKSLTDTWNLKDKAYLYNKPLSKPVYIFLFGSMMQKLIIHNLGVFGTNIYDKDVASVTVFTKCDNKNDFYDCSLFTVKKGTEKINWANKALEKNPPYKEIIFVRTTGLIKYRKPLYKNKKYPYDRMLEIIESDKGMYFLIGNRKIKNSMLHRMLIFRDDFKNFKLIYNDFPNLIIYKVVK